MVQIEVTIRPIGFTPRASPGTTYGVGAPSCSATISAAGLPSMVLGSVVREDELENTPATKEACVEESVALSGWPAESVARMEI